MGNVEIKDGIKKPIRSKSGITPLTVVLPPKKCDHGNCVYCPGGDAVPQSYTDKSPAIMRAAALDYDIKKQVEVRLNNLIAMGHPTDKIELIIIGGTFLQYPKKFKYDYIKACYDVLNGVLSQDLEEAKKFNEVAKHRIVALCIENRPDNCSGENIEEMLSFGCTRVEIGVQILDDYVYKMVNRGHKVSDVVDATRRLKEAGFKIGYHIMPGIPYSNYKNDMEKFKLIFEDSKFRPDQLKLYPCQIVEGSPLALNYEKIGYKPYDNEIVKKILIEMFKLIPDYCRVMRVMREIPKEKMKVSAASTSMRGEINKELKSGEIKEIRFREVGLQKGGVDLSLKLKIISYDASDGEEYFLEMINSDDILFGLLRLRLSESGAMVREVHVYGQALNLGESSGESQHRGIGRKLMDEAERISFEKGYGQLRVISGVGVREYYRKLGYRLEGYYMVKKLL